MKTRALLAIVLVFAFGVTFLNGEYAPPRDGNWWQTQNRAVKLIYVLGFIDGMEEGSDFGYENEPAKDNIKAKDLFSKAWNKYVSGITNDQVVDGLDEFYKDYRNRRIRMYDGFWIVIKTISGTPKDEIEKMIENIRLFHS